MQGQNLDDSRLYSLVDASQQLGGLSIWSLRKHVFRGNVRPTRLGRRVFLSSAEIARIQREGLPSLSDAKGQRAEEPIVSTAQRKNSTRALQGDTRAPRG